MRRAFTKRIGGFTLVEMLFSMMIIGVVLLAFVGIFLLYQRSSTQTNEFATAQQNARVALDYVADYLRQAGTKTDYARGQRFIVHAAPYQVAFNADMDNGQVIDGLAPLSALNRTVSPYTVPFSGTVIYSPPRDYVSGAETYVLTLDSNADGVIDGSDKGDDADENGTNPHMFVLKRYQYGYESSGGANLVRQTDLALIRGPIPYKDGSRPQPLFQYFYDHDENISTPDKLWGDDNPEDGQLNDTEITTLTRMPDSLLSSIRKVRVTVVSESNKFNKKFADNDGFLDVTMNSEVYVRNSKRSNSIIYGIVYHDVNSNAVYDAGETGIPNVEVRLAGLNRVTQTNNFGYYYLPLTPGDYAVQEVDPFGFISTTPNLVSVALSSGEAETVNFGDVAGSPVGVIRGKVFEDLDQDGVQTVGENGIQDVLVSLDTGEQTTTDANGDYSFVVQLGNYNVVETDPDGYASTTPNSVPADLLVANDTLTIDFGDVANPAVGTLEGYVYLDDDEDGIMDAGEGGIANVTLMVNTGDSTVTNASGYYKFSLEPGVYSVKERDLPGYMSTTVNTYIMIFISPDTVVSRNFGDILETQTDFVEIEIGNTERALSVGSMNFDEDNKNDPDIVLGTPFTGGIGNLLVYQNQWKNSNTALTELFDQVPTYRRDAEHHVNSLSVYDFSGDGTDDVLGGLENSTGNNIVEFFTDNSGNLSNSPDWLFITAGNTYVLDTKLASFNNDGQIDLVVGLRSSSGTWSGGFQEFKGAGSGNFTAGSYVTTAGKNVTYNLGEVWAIDAGDVDGDGDNDIVVGSKTNSYSGFVDVYTNNGNASGNFQWSARYAVSGAVNDIKVVDMMEDDAGDPDLLVAVSTSDNQGMVELWLNDEGEFGRPDTTGMAFGTDVTPNLPNDAFNAQGEALSLATARINRDIFPDVIVGNKNSSFYTGDLYLLKTFGLLPTNGFQMNKNLSGEVITIDVADFNKDNKTDVVVGTRTSATQGKLVVYFNDEQ